MTTPAETRPPTGREVLAALGAFAGALALFGLDLGVVIWTAQSWSQVNEALGWVLILGGGLAMIPLGMFAMAMKVAFAATFFSWLFDALFALERGRALVAVLLIGGGGWTGVSFAMHVWNHGLNDRGDVREALGVAALTALLCALGLGMLALAPERGSSSSPQGGA